MRTLCPAGRAGSLVCVGPSIDFKHAVYIIYIRENPSTHRACQVRATSPSLRRALVLILQRL